ncbi:MULTISPECIES: HlyD family type I secretion periplasmic adaptor subunit [Deefgea]|nr:MULTISPECIES: HlyD family type I secretion periplasmic adaptor subunit [Deefgea]MBM9887387.1 HlyD family type I secretion periplasmic adaptor subunit [Deefgea sp. CFH1-16]
MLAMLWSDLVRHPLRYGVSAVLVTVVALFVWAIYAPLDQGVVSQGVVKVTGSRKTVQALVPGKVAQILVKDGQRVKKNDPLIKLDDTNARAQLGIVETQFLTSLAIEARLRAEREQKNEVLFPKELSASNPIARDAMSLQRQLFNTRRQSLKAEVDILHKNIEGLLAQQRSLKDVKSSKEEQLKTLKVELESIRDLAKDGFVPKTRMFELERSVSAINAGISDDIGQIARLEQDLAERRLQIIRRTQDYQKEVETQLAQIVQDVAVSTDRMRSLQFELDNAVIVAPLEGTVVQLTVHTIGAVLQSGSPILDLVPSEEPLIIEAQIPVHLIDKVKLGNEVQLRFSAFNHVSTPTVNGRLILVSADSVIDPQTKLAFYSAQIAINPDGLEVLKNNKIIPGMPVDVIIKTGERSLMNYFLKPLQNRISSAMKEE